MEFSFGLKNLLVIETAFGFAIGIDFAKRATTETDFIAAAR
ncbi:hypothetical protein [Paraburkholderia phenoliruptrix]|nr:hypothetical protein [Paraburkholderia phenoliruptrix]WMY10906.1 hypothetical protein P3F88_29940 [Paraburkholderia phenoliruptrix]